MMPDDDATARTLIDSVFGSNTGSELPRAFEAMATFRIAVDAWSENQSASVAGVLSEHIDRTDNPSAAVHDVCAAGAIANASLLAGTRLCTCCDAWFRAMGIEMCDDADLTDRAAADLINIALSGQLALLTEALQLAYQESTVDNLCELAVSLVDIHVEMEHAIAEMAHGQH